ncbi:hypothetical protein COCSUDRAFT_45883 [Coccomyxa subellipsoidea C-169]|uniref:RING-CH-type domain-containing protein n=1 Tax=Coccomyxa subellipsoidea (strain C-169) TaxID=574566 RepID=I0ZA21_COCSC|nr:hypothetical protein COCSUDRAFT_45883 [Coccomyxa subellipsoidea C-169]EIE27490.1 hypothetical protein COCSUDRAFT_45883 [Coccomyxa subellipsoidea C-169]|eukprot:XP_005652034.1 hypothetical protein COCSUDRAFT_45883 [Coccomyxa subellipsoidea C-169]
MDHPAATAAPQDIETGHGTRLNDVSGGDGEVAAEAHHPSAGLDNVLDEDATGSGRASGGSPDSASAATHLLSLFGRRSSSIPRGGSPMKRSASGTQPMCLICLENLTAEDFECGEAMSLDCQCRGELALRHRSCAEKWSRVKGDRVCDVCKSTINNLPEVVPLAPGTDAGSDNGNSLFDDMEDRNHAHPLHGAFVADQMPGSADIVFDCIRVTWVAMIICILFFEMNLATALWTGLVVGIAYTMFARAMYRQQLALLQREMLREHQQHLPAQRSPSAGSPRSPRALNEVAAQPEEAPDDGATSAASDSDADDVEANALPEAEARDVHVCCWSASRQSRDFN